VETMTGLDAKFLYSETPTAHMHTVKVAVSDTSAIEGGFSYDTLSEVLGQRDELVGGAHVVVVAKDAANLFSVK